MGLALSDDHLALAEACARFVAERCPMSVTREALEAPTAVRPPWWSAMIDLGWMGLAVSEDSGGSGYGVAELAIVLDALGHGCVAGPFLPTVAAAIALDRWSTDAERGTSMLKRLLDGSCTAGIGLRPGGPILGGQDAEVFIFPVAGDSGWTWVAADRSELVVSPLESFDATRRMATIAIPDDVEFSLDDLLDCDVGAPVGLFTLLAASESIGIGRWATDTAASYAKDRVQFGRPIGQFQGVKHRCADMVVRTEATTALVWDAARGYDRRDAGWQVALDAACADGPASTFRTTQDCIQVLGGIGYTWEHDAHLYLKRAAATAHFVPAARRWRAGMVSLVRGGSTRSVSIELPPEAEAIRERVGAFVSSLVARPKAEWNDVIADSGYLVPHWPKPYGLDASPIEQLVIDEAFSDASIRRRHLQVAAWALPTIIGHGTDAQQSRWVGPSLRGELMWCQMFSEPNAGSDLASLTTAATKVDGGWSITGQKVWTSMAQWAQWAICLARTDPEAPKHEGIGCFMIDMSSPGIELRPLRELTGMEMFNEVFLTDVFVPDDCLVGGPTEGWECARTTLANERVSMGKGASFGPGVTSLFELAETRECFDDPLIVDELGSLLVTSHAAAMLGVRSTLRALSGAQPGSEASVRKLLGVEHEQHIQEVGLRLLGDDATLVEGAAAAWTSGFLGNRALSIAGGTSEIQRNVIAERLLGLPKDP